MIESEEECSINSINEANIPVDIWIGLVPEEDEDYRFHKGQFRLYASNYMPRRGRVEEQAYLFYADSKEEFLPILEKIKNLYQIALNKIEGMIEGTEDHLYYWEKENES